LTNFAASDLTPSPACLAVAATGEVFVGVDRIGSLGKEPGKGSIVKLIDSDNDGKVDKHTIFAQVDNPRGIISLGDKVYVLHTTFNKETGIATGMDLVVFVDKNNDGVADGAPEPLIQNISSPKFIQSRGTDHATNGIRMGIDGWIYIAAGDFGFYNAVDRDGTKLTLHGGGIVRVRPNGKEMELYTHGTRNIYDVAIDPYMNIFTRDNTNDGGGWNIRFSHHIQSGEYGYPLLFKNFTEEIIPGLVDVGGGSGTGSLFMDEPTWPDKYNHVPMMADWGNSQLYIHRVTADGPSFTQKDEEFIKLNQITDLDVDGSGRLYLSAWDGAGYSGSPDKGFIVRAVPNDWKYKAFPNLAKASIKDLSA
ncbi:MAG: heme-binding protein, partial [Pedobacter sp.]